MCLALHACGAQVKNMAWQWAGPPQSSPVPSGCPVQPGPRSAVRSPWSAVWSGPAWSGLGPAQSGPVQSGSSPADSSLAWRPAAWSSPDRRQRPGTVQTAASGAVQVPAAARPARSRSHVVKLGLVWSSLVREWWFSVAAARSGPVGPVGSGGVVRRRAVQRRRRLVQSVQLGLAAARRGPFQRWRGRVQRRSLVHRD